MVSSKYFSVLNLSTSLILVTLMWTTSTKEKMIMVEWNMVKLTSTNFKMVMTIDTKATAFAACVLLITSAIIIYSNFYMTESKKKNQFMKLIMAFVLSMMVLIFSPSMISMILGWEGLGMSSFILIMFYQNKKSLNSSFYTMMMNRMGDIMMMMSMVKMMSLSSWSFTSSMFCNNQSMTLMMMAAAFSKSAQMPFSSWLTEAMAAPTPISALVHSSTLVTAGVFLFIRFEVALKYKSISTAILTVSTVTLMMASMNSAMEWDIKKIIALSTLSQMSMMFITISMNMINLAMFHLLVHATFKALIFLCSSTLIMLTNTQDIRKMGSPTKNMFITKMSFNTASLSLSGFPFMSSFYSKELIMETMLIKKMNLMFIVLFYMCMAMTVFYSLKMMMFINTAKFKQTMITLKENKAQKQSKLILLLPSIMYGNKMNWIMNLNFKIPHLTKMNKFTPIMMTVMVAVLIKEVQNAKQTSTMMNYMEKNMISYMWFTKNMSIMIKKLLLTSFQSKFKNSEKMVFTQMTKTMKTKIKKTSTTNFKLIHKSSYKMNMMIFTAMFIIT